MGMTQKGERPEGRVEKPFVVETSLFIYDYETLK
jgi:hypothetical protein